MLWDLILAGVLFWNGIKGWALSSLFSCQVMSGLLCDPMDCSSPVSSVHGIFYWSGLPFPSPGDLPDPAIEPRSPALADGVFTTEPAGEPKVELRKILLIHSLICIWGLSAGMQPGIMPV